MIYPGSLIATDVQLGIYREHDSESGALNGKFATDCGPFLVIAVYPEAFSHTTKIYITYVISKSTCGWTFMSSEYEHFDP